MKTFTDSQKTTVSLRNKIAVRVFRVQKDAQFIEDELSAYDFDTLTLETIEECLRTACANLKVATGEILAAIKNNKEEEVAK